MKAIFLTLILTVSTLLCGYAQTETNILRKIATPDTQTGASVVIHNKSGVNPSRGNRDAKIKGYRVRIFFDNSQNGRNQSYTVETDFKAKYPNIPVYLTYETPYFKITVGDCMTKEEATMLWGKLAPDYPKAFIVTEEIPLSKFETLPEAIVAVDSTAVIPSLF